MKTALIAFVVMAASPLFAQSLAERARTEEPTCAVIDAAYELCLVDGIIVADSGVMLAKVENGLAFFGSSDGLISQAEARPKDVGVSAYYRQEFAPVDPAILITDLGQLTPDDYGSYTFSTTIEQLPVESPNVVTLLDLGAFDVVIWSTFPNMYQMPDHATLSSEQLDEHVNLISAFRALSDS